MSGSLVALLASAIGGTSMAATRHLAAYADPATIGVLRYVGAALLLLPLALVQRARFPARADWPGIVALALLFFGLFPILMNASLEYTTAARAALALSTVPLVTIIVAAALGREAMGARKTLGVLLAMAGVGVGLAGGLAVAPPGAWRGDALMLAGTLCMALYNIYSGPFIARASPIAVAAMGMAIGGAVLTALALGTGGLAALAAFSQTTWLVALYLAAIGGALGYWMWAVAIGRTTPTLVAISVTVNPLFAGIVGALALAEPITPALLVGLVMVLAGILVASRDERRPPAPA